MPNTSRDEKVFLLLLCSMTILGMILIALQNNPPSAGAFCLYTYNNLVSIKQTIDFRKKDFKNWSKIKVEYFQNEADISKAVDDINNISHFIISDGTFLKDGYVIATEQWKQQLTIKDYEQADQPIIKIYVIAAPPALPITDLQLSRLNDLVETLSRKFNIATQNIHYPVRP